MKIALSGSHTTGKTTLCEYIHKKYQLPLLYEKARFFMENKYGFDPLEEEVETFINFQEDVLSAQIEDEQKHESFVTDRPLIDSVAYLKERLIKERYSDYTIFQNYYVKAIENQSDYDLIFFIKVQNSMIKKDGFRNINEFYIRAIEEIIELEYNKLGLIPIVIDTDSLEERKILVDIYLRSIE